MMQMTIQVDGLDALRSRLGDSTILDREFRTAEHDALLLVRDRARELAPGDMLPRSVQYSADSGGLSGVVGSVAKTALSIEMGRQVGEMPSFEAIANWMQRKGIATGSAVRIASRRRVRFRKGSPEAKALHDDAVRIAFRIAETGTKPLAFMIPAGRDETKPVQEAFHQAAQRALRKWAGR